MIVLKQTAHSRYAINRNGKVRIFASNQIRNPIHSMLAVRLQETPKKFVTPLVGGMVSRETGAEFRWKLRGKSVNYEGTFNNESSGRSSLGRHHHLSCLLLNNRASAGIVLPAAISTPFSQHFQLASTFSLR